VDVLASTSDEGTEASEIRDGVPYHNPYTDRQASFPLIAAVEQGNVQNITSERGSTRLVVVGDSLALDNELIDTTPANHYFAALAVDWLLDRPQVLLQGLVPRPLKEYRVVMGRQKIQMIELLFLAGMPGVILALGGFVWWRRRK
jgi:LPXTG-motif cell wall-anchored protein